LTVASNQKIIYVYESFKSTTPNFLGTLFVENVRGRESYSFEYDADWLKSSANYMYLDPDLQLYAGRQYPTGAKNVFGLFADSSPDRWGRLLMTRRERILAEQEGRKPRKLLDSDFLMGVYDETRMGASRFKHVIECPDGRFRRLVPDELDQLQGFPKGWTDTGMTDGHRAFCMGNALVTGVPHRIGEAMVEVYSL